jgi:branched-chain amino acid aminotransferase
MKIRVSAPLRRKPKLPKDPEAFGFGKIFTDRFFMQTYTLAKGWHRALIVPRSQFPVLDPAAAVLHYGQEIFEGLKAYRRPDGNINLFRPADNAKRFNGSAERMEMPLVPVSDHLAAIRTLITEEHSWVPSHPGTSLYIRPTMIATNAELGVHPSSSYLHYILLSLAGNYFGTGFKSIAVKIEDEHRRAVIGGTGTAKTGGNYAASLAASQRAQKEGYAQVLWLDGKHGKYVEEVGAMNICFVYQNKTIVTPALSGSILPGITRDSLLRLAPDLGYEAKEDRLEVQKVLADIQTGKITEAFGCGTAVVIAPVGRFGFKGKNYVVGSGKTGPVAKKLKQKLTAIQYGIDADWYGWTETIEVKKN